MATHSSTLAWKIPWMEEPGRLQPMGSRRVRHLLSNFTFTFHFHALEKEMATHQCSCLENPRDGRAWWAAVYGVAQSQTRLKRLSSDNSNCISSHFSFTVHIIKPSIYCYVRGFPVGSDGKESACNA